MRRYHDLQPKSTRGSGTDHDPLARAVLARAGRHAEGQLQAAEGADQDPHASGQPGPSHSDVGPFEAQFALTPSWSGGTDVQIPPLGAMDHLGYEKGDPFL